MMMTNNVLIDGSFLSYRSQTQYCQALGYKSSGGHWIPTGTLFSFFRDLIYLIDRYGASAKWAVVWDRESTVRKQIDPQYKANRRKDYNEEAMEHHSNMRRQMKELQVMLPSAGIAQYWCPGYEADDVLATLIDMSKGRTVVVARDKDLYQLLRRGVRLYDLSKEKGYKWFSDEYGIEPEQWITVQALAGDSTDNIKGASGIGIKTAVKLVRTYKTTKGVIESKVLKEADVDTIRLAERLVWLRKDLLLDFEPSAFNRQRFQKYLETKRLQSVLERMDAFESIQLFDMMGGDTFSEEGGVEF